jgi:hypothetical protein
MTRIKCSELITWSCVEQCQVQSFHGCTHSVRSCPMFSCCNTCALSAYAAACRVTSTIQLFSDGERGGVRFRDGDCRGQLRRVSFDEQGTVGLSAVVDTTRGAYIYVTYASRTLTSRCKSPTHMFFASEYEQTCGNNIRNRIVRSIVPQNIIENTSGAAV